MTDENQSGGGQGEEVKRPFVRHSTADTYRALLEIEVKSLLGRVGELTESVGSLFSTVNDIALTIEEAVVKLERMHTGLEYCRQEIGVLNRKVLEQSTAIKIMERHLETLKERIAKIPEEEESG